MTSVPAMFSVNSFYTAKLQINAICKLNLLYRLYCFLKKNLSKSYVFLKF